MSARRPMFAAALALVLGAACADDARRPLGATCDSSGQCESGLCLESRCVTPGSSVDLGAGTCPGIRKCVDACALTKTGAPATTCSQACFQAADDQMTQMTADEIGVCTFVEHSCEQPGAPGSDSYRQAYYGCERQNCTSAVVACYASGGDAATGTCSSVATCIAHCPSNDSRCDRDCAAAGSSAAVTAWVDWWLCVRSQCESATATSATFDACATRVGSGDGACVAASATCFGRP